MVVAVLVLLVGVYAVAVSLTRDQWAGSAERAGTKVTFTAKTPDGSPPGTDELAETRHVVNVRLLGLGISDPVVAVDGTTLTVSVPGDGDSVRDIASASGRLYVRPVLHAIPSQSTTSGSGGSSAPLPHEPIGDAQRVADEKELRQSTEPANQVLAMQYQATRCGEEDALVGIDDPDLPLVTCSTDGRQVYLLGQSIIGGDQISEASSGWDEASGSHVVDVGFDPQATKIWADFTAANIGTQTAFVLDSKVVSAPQIQEVIPGGRTVITGNFTADQARDLAATLAGGYLPLTLIFESSQPTTLPGSTGSAAVRIGLGAGGIVLALALVGGVVYLVTSRRTRKAR